MPRTLTIDGLQLLRVQLVRNPNGDAEVFVEYALKAGAQVIQTIHKPLGPLGSARRAAVLALLDGLAADATAAEQL